MSQSINIALIGATGSVGEALVELLEEREFPVKELHLLASSESAGQSLSFRGRQVRVRSLDAFDFSQVQLAFFAAGSEVTKACHERALAAGCSLIDMSAALPLAQAPCVLPELGREGLPVLKAPFQVSAPTPSAVACALVLTALRPVVQPHQLQLTAMLSMSTLGRSGVQELARQTAELLNGRPLEPKGVDRQVAFNLLAQVGGVDEQGHAELEKRLAAELPQLLELPDLSVSATCALVPVFFGDSLALSVQCDSPVDVTAAQQALEAATGIELVEAGDYPTAVGDAVGQDQVYVGRVRAGVSDPRQLNLWIASDNVRKGAALNAVQIAELLIKHYL
ncbi:aspartate-semialdehyde dehydrogenase [Pseudomonas berkeleyensis]|uniref:Aspartate-semialdehyde dehydrogenase n=1 Tax=Pseudomonas berkeleyensis TaxID=2726956 RepID=A0A7G5DHX1_9PSED|nr:aspartate-semialdehyde dehydrogenase [Pseudomonas berkeleyensis]QMV61346.1 aspartate-semialdehyde dehydrogenase [Pseudomonas berkeleyensis]WSO36774.1 aspartate-semialdehyde dehydrogenase [Pseudomonas berkeleyensis]